MKNKQTFHIQPGNPQPDFEKDFAGDSLSELFPLMFRENEESAYLFWNGIPIRFHYAYELYKNIEGLLNLCNALANQDEGNIEILLVTEQFFMEWKGRWGNDEIEIRAKFSSVRSSFDQYAKCLNALGTIRVSQVDFLEEWNRLFKQVHELLSGQKVENHVLVPLQETIIMVEHFTTKMMKA